MGKGDWLKLLVAPFVVVVLLSVTAGAAQAGFSGQKTCGKLSSGTGADVRKICADRLVSTRTSLPGRHCGKARREALPSSGPGTSPVVRHVALSGTGSGSVPELCSTPATSGATTR